MRGNHAIDGIVISPVIIEPTARRSTEIRATNAPITVPITIAMVVVLVIPMRYFFGLHAYVTDRHLDYMAKLILATGSRPLIPDIPGIRQSHVYVFRDLRAVDVQILTIGQYLRPTPAHLPMARYYRPEEFRELKRRHWQQFDRLLQRRRQNQFLRQTGLKLLRNCHVRSLRTRPQSYSEISELARSLPVQF